MTERSDSILRHLSAFGGFDIRHSSVLRFAVNFMKFQKFHIKGQMIDKEFTTEGHEKTK